ncbi:MAG: dihydrofolate reductase [Casimicrobium sp.]
MTSPLRPRLALIAAVSRNGIIGKNGTLPWHLSADLKHFKALTTGKRIVMGRRTWESFPKPLPNREHVVVTSRALDVPEGAVCVRTLSQALALANPTDPVFVIGGNSLYEEAIALVDDLYLTEIDADVDGDTKFPLWDRAAFVEMNRETHQGSLAKDASPTQFDFVHYTRRLP